MNIMAKINFLYKITWNILHEILGQILLILGSTGLTGPVDNFP